MAVVGQHGVNRAGAAERLKEHLVLFGREMLVASQKQGEVQTRILADELFGNAALPMKIHVPASAGWIAPVGTPGALRQAIEQDGTRDAIRAVGRQSLTYGHAQIVRHYQEAFPAQLTRELERVRRHR